MHSCRDRNIGFSTVARSNEIVHAAVSKAENKPDLWQPALDSPSKQRREKQRKKNQRNKNQRKNIQRDTKRTKRQNKRAKRVSMVADLTDFVGKHNHPTDTRFIVRREPLHPGAQRSLLPSQDYRYQGYWTDSTDSAVRVDLHMRTHVHIEDTIGRVKDMGGTRFPFTSFAANKAWLQTVAFADGMVRWFQRLCLTGRLARAKHKSLRWMLWHTPASIQYHHGKPVMLLSSDSVITPIIMAAYRRINLLI